ncbi:hypothetical protein SDC9_140291 [bioreactor metagenome]|uniref:Uncharacterized protein n=1 Tax=bioreactor metagenome TaxID=1076179 RepID=A0A645DV42_9ZZZZ
MLIHDGNRGKLEEEVEKRHPKGGGEGAALSGGKGHGALGHVGDGLGDAAPLGDDVRHQHHHQRHDNQDGYGGRRLAHHGGAEEGDEEDGQTDEQGAQPIGQAEQGVEGGAAGGKGGGRGGADHDEVGNLIEVGEHHPEPAVKMVGEAAVVIQLVPEGVAHAIPEEHRV